MIKYRLPDEPAPSKLSHFAVNPLFPFISAMLGGLWIAWPWFLFNSYAVGSPTIKKELAWLCSGLIAVCVVVLILVPMLSDFGIVTSSNVKYADLFIIVIKLSIIYSVYVLQSRTIEIYVHYGGVLRNGVWVLLAMVWVSWNLPDSIAPGWLLWVFA